MIDTEQSNSKSQAVYTSAPVRELDRMAIADFGVSSHALMTRAAQATFDFIRGRRPQVERFCVLCGLGNNAGAGDVILASDVIAHLRKVVNP